MRVLIDQCVEVAAFRPPPVEQLTESECSRLIAVLAGVVDGWRGAVEVGIRLGEFEQHNADPGPTSVADDLWFHASATPIALGLTPEAAVSLLCVNLGAEMPAAPDAELTAVDLALLEVWAGRAVSELATALGAGPAGEVVRRRGTPGELIAETQDVVVSAGLTFSGGMPAGAVLVGAEVARTREKRPPVRLGDRPGLLLQARLTVNATIATDPVPLCELLSLEKGDVLLLGDKAGIEATLTASECVVASGRPGAQEGTRALRIMGGLLIEREHRLGEISDGF